MLALCLEVVRRQCWRLILVQPSVLVGPVPPCDLALTYDPMAQRRCEIRIEGESAWVRPLDPGERAIKNDRPVEGDEPLSPADVLLVGNTRIRASIVVAPLPPPEADLTDATCPGTGPLRLAELSTRGTELRRLVASHPAAPPALLESLSCCPDAATQRAVARNPNTPKGTLLRLAQHYPAELSDNPVFALLLLEDPRLLAPPGPPPPRRRIAG